MPDPRVSPDGLRDLGHISSGGLAHGGHGVDGGDPLGQEGVGGQLGQLAGPGVHGDDPVRRNPVLVDLRQRLDGRLSFVSLLSTNENSVRRHQIINGSSLRKKFRVGENLERDSGFDVVPQDVGDALGCLDGDGALLHHNLPSLSLLDSVCDHPGSQLDILQVSSLAFPNAKGLGRGVHTDENQLKCRIFSIANHNWG